MRIIKLVAISFFVLGTTSGCVFFQNTLDRLSPPVSAAGQQSVSIEESQLSLTKIDPNLSTYFAANKLKESIADSINTSIADYEDDDIKVKSFKQKISFGNQAINLTAKFRIQIPEKKIEVDGSFSGLVAIGSEHDNVKMRPAFKKFSISKVKKLEGANLSTRAAIALARPLVSKFIDNANGVIFAEPIIIDLGWSEITSFNPKKIFEGQDVVVDADIVEITSTLKHAVFRINKKGLYAMFQVDSETTGQSHADLMDPSSLSQPAKISFRKFSGNFDRKWSEHFDELKASSIVETQIKKRKVARLINLVLGSNISLSQKFSMPKLSFEDTIEYDRKNIDCTKVREPFKYKRYRRDRCNWDCDVSTPFGDIKDGNLVCVAARTACNVREESRVAADNVRRESAKATHDALQESKIAACKITRATSEFVALGKFQGDTKLSGLSKASFQKLIFSDDLSSASVDFNAAIKANLKTNFKIQPYDLGYVFMCQSDVQDTVSSKLEATLPQSQYEVSVMPVQSDQGINLITSFEAFNYSATLDPSPIIGLVADNNFSSKCRIFRTVLGISVGAGGVANDLGLIDLPPPAELLLRGKTDGKYSVPNVNFLIESQKVKIGDSQEIKISPNWGEKTIGFAVKIN